MPQEAPECVSEHLKSENFLGGIPPDPPREGDLWAQDPLGPGIPQALAMPLLQVLQPE